MFPCFSCKRHIKSNDTSCPFCGASHEHSASPLALSLGAFLLASTAMLGLSGCSTSTPTNDEAGTTTSAGDGQETAMDTTEEEESTDDSDERGGSFYAGADWEEEESSGVSACEPWLQDCPEGEKCVAYASAQEYWDANKCVLIAGDAAPGEPCTYDGPVSSMDDCDGDGFCWFVDENDAGTCHAFCEGSPDDPVCADSFSCLIANNGSLNLCVQTCDPLANECGDGQSCVWFASAFICVQATGESSLGEPCGGGLSDPCQSDQLCIAAEVLPSCDGAACCTQYCNLLDPLCELEGTTCVPFLEEAPPDLENVGVCALP